MKTIVVAPHADDELLGCGGTLLKRFKSGYEVSWLLMTSISEVNGWEKEDIKKRDKEIKTVREMLNINPKNFYELKIPTTKLDEIPMNNIIKKISEVFLKFQPNEVFLPHPGDIHSDHRITFEAAQACTKWFRYPSIRKIYTYETTSETEFQLDAKFNFFNPNTYIDITNHIDSKIKLLEVYRSEIKEHPFPRSIKAIKALATLRGSQMGASSAEAFCLLSSREF